MTKLKYKVVLSTIMLLFLTASISLASIEWSSPVTVSFDDTPLPAVLQMLAEQNNLNIVVAPDVTGNISLSLENVTLADALSAILSSKGYNYFLSGDIIIVKPITQVMSGEMISRLYRLKYIEGAEAKSAIEPLKSEKGVVVELGAPNSKDGDGKDHSSQLVITDFEYVHEIVKNLLKAIDLPRHQISIEVKIIETNLNKDEKLGINWPKSISTAITNAGNSTGTSSDNSTSTDQMAAFMPLETGSWQLGNLTVGQLSMVIDFLTQRNNSKLLSNPRVTTLEDKTAKIEIQTVIPVQTVNRFTEGAVIQDIVTFEDEDVGISLNVTPHVSDDSTIIMEVTPLVQEIIGYTGPTDNQRPITSSRTVTTTVSVKNNETLALGGLIKETRFDGEERIFLLGHIPILGGLFTHKTSELKTTDLLILITPRIIN